MMNSNIGYYEPNQVGMYNLSMAQPVYTLNNSTIPHTTEVYPEVPCPDVSSVYQMNPNPNLVRHNMHKPDGEQNSWTSLNLDQLMSQYCLCSDKTAHTSSNSSKKLLKPKPIGLSLNTSKYQATAGDDEKDELKGKLNPKSEGAAKFSVDTSKYLATLYEDSYEEVPKPKTRKRGRPRIYPVSTLNTRKDVILKSIFRQMRKYFSKDFKRFFNYERCNISKIEDRKTEFRKQVSQYLQNECGLMPYGGMADFFI